MATIDILIPTYHRPSALAVTLTSLAAQTFHDFRVVISDQSEHADSTEAAEVKSVIRVLRAHGNAVDLHHHLPPRGMAEQRQFLLDQTTAPFVLFTDDDLIFEPDVLERLLRAIREEGCGFVGNSVIGLSYAGDRRPDQEAIEFWEGPVQPEVVRPGTPAWQRYRLHNAANLYHVQQRLGLAPERQRKYKVAWVAACVLYDAEKLRAVGAFNFWRDLPVNHCGEDVLAQLRVMAQFGGCGVIPSGVYHQELPTTVPDRGVNAPEVLGVTR